MPYNTVDTFVDVGSTCFRVEDGSAGLKSNPRTSERFFVARALRTSTDTCRLTTAGQR